MAEKKRRKRIKIETDADHPAEEPAAEEAAADGEPEAPDDAAGSEDEESPEKDTDAALEDEVADLKDKLLRALAETENVRRRGVREREDSAKYAITHFAREMLTVADNLRRALDSVDADTRNENEDLDNLMVGVEMTEREMMNAFERIGIKPIAALGQKFDHNFHEAMFDLEDKSKPPGTVIQELETGYMLHERLLRPAKVAVAKGGPAPAVDEAKDEAAEDEAADEDIQATGSTAAYDQKPGGDSSGSKVDKKL